MSQLQQLQLQAQQRHGKNPYAVELGRLGGLKGGKARAESLTPSERSEIGKKAAKSRWAGYTCNVKRPSSNPRKRIISAFGMMEMGENIFSELFPVIQSLKRGKIKVKAATPEFYHRPEVIKEVDIEKVRQFAAKYVKKPKEIIRSRVAVSKPDIIPYTPKPFVRPPAEYSNKSPYGIASDLLQDQLKSQ